jgi:group I intron endonuclease
MNIVYGLFEDDKLRYIGKTSINLKERLRCHIKDAKNLKIHNHRVHWIRKLISENKLPQIKPLITTKSEHESVFFERKLIAKYKYICNLVNSTEGGEGNPHTAETKAKISASKIGKLNPMYGKNHSQKSKLSMSKNRSGPKHHNFGKKLKPETIEKMKIAFKLRKRSKKEIDFLIMISKKRCRSVVQIKNGKVIKIYNSILEAAKELHCAASSISIALKYPARTARGFNWKYKND